MSFDERFGDLRSRLQDRPTPLTFARLCRALLEMWEEAPERVNQEIIPYLTERLEGWDADVCSYPGFLNPHWLQPQEHALGPLALLRQLDLSYQYLGGGVVDAITRQPQMKGLRTLNLAANRLDASAARQLAATNHLDGLTHLDLGKNPLGDDGVAALLTAPWMSRVLDLELWSVGLTTADVFRGVRLEAHERLDVRGAPEGLAAGLRDLLPGVHVA